MLLEELCRLVSEVQHRRIEPDAFEVTDSLSAFANRPGGGIILFAVLGTFLNAN